MRLTLQEAGWLQDGAILREDGSHVYDVAGLPANEQAVIAKFNDAWRFLRWNDKWHGNWSGNYPTPDAALEGLREELITAAA